MAIYGYSKSVALTLNEWGMPFGLKKMSRLTPSVAVDEIAFIRGLFDTDGSVYRKYGRYLQIQFKCVNPNLIEFVRMSLNRLGFSPTEIRKDETKFRFCLSRQAEIDRFFRVISPKNLKHLKRFRILSEDRTFRTCRRRSKQF